MNVSAMHMSAIRYAQIFLEVIIVPVIRVITYKIQHIALTLMNVLTTRTTAVNWPRVQIHLVSSTALATVVSLEMELIAEVSVDKNFERTIRAVHWRIIFGYIVYCLSNYILNSNVHNYQLLLIVRNWYDPL